jgi:hypothetical protein
VGNCEQSATADGGRDTGLSGFNGSARPPLLSLTVSRYGRSMLAANTMRLDWHGFSIDSASFRYITQSWSGAGWDFDFTVDASPTKRQADERT